MKLTGPKREKQHNVKNSSGFVALISVIIISMLLLSIVVTGAEQSVRARVHLMQSEFKFQSFALARSCINKARLQRILDEKYVGSEEVSIQNEKCFIGSIVENQQGLLIKTKATVKGAVTSLEASVNDNFEIMEISEMKSI